MNLTRISLIAFIACISLVGTANAYAEAPVLDANGYQHSWHKFYGNVTVCETPDKCVTLDNTTVHENLTYVADRSKSITYFFKPDGTLVLARIKDGVEKYTIIKETVPWNLDTSDLSTEVRDRCATVIDEDADQWGVRQTAGTTCYAASSVLKAALRSDKAPKGYTCTIKLKVAACKKGTRALGTARIDTDATVAARRIHAGNQVYICGVARMPGRIARTMVASAPNACDTSSEMVNNVIKSEFIRHGMNNLHPAAGCVAQNATVDVCRSDNECMWLVPVMTGTYATGGGATIAWDQALGIYYSRIDLDC